MQSNTTNAEAMTAKDLRIKELLETISTLRAALEKSFEYVQAEEFNNPRNKTARLVEQIDEAMWQADEVLK